MWTIDYPLISNYIFQTIFVRLAFDYLQNEYIVQVKFIIVPFQNQIE